MFTWKIALRYLTAGGWGLSKRALLAVIGVALMVMLWIVLVSVQSGFIDAFRERVLGASSHVTVTRYGVYFDDYDEIQRRIETVGAVEETSPYMLLQMQITGNNLRTRPGVFVKGVDIELLPRMNNIEAMINEGSLAALQWDGTNSDVQAGQGQPDEQEPAIPAARIGLGSVLATKIGVEVGDTVRLNSPLTGMRELGGSGAGSDLAWADYEVGAIIKTGFLDYDSKLVLMDYRALQTWYGRGDVVTGVEVVLDDAFAAVAVSEAIAEAIGSGMYQVLPWPDMHRNLFRSLTIQKQLFTGVATAGVVVASFLVLCVLIMIVLEKRKDVGVLRSMGATQGAIRVIFLLQGLAIGVIGAIVGVIGGYLMCLLLRSVRFGLAIEVYRIDYLPVGMHWEDFVVGGLSAVALCVLATIYPAHRAARVMPLDAIRAD